MKQTKETLTNEESQELMNLGIPFYCATIFRTEVPARVCGYRDDHLFTLNNLLNLLPLMIQINSKNYFLQLTPWIGDFKNPIDDEYKEIDNYLKDRSKKGFWSAGYADCGWYFLDSQFQYEQLIDCLFDLVKWCIETGYIKPEEL